MNLLNYCCSGHRLQRTCFYKSLVRCDLSWNNEHCNQYEIISIPKEK